MFLLFVGKKSLVNPTILHTCCRALHVGIFVIYTIACFVHHLKEPYYVGHIIIEVVYFQHYLSNFQPSKLICVISNYRCKGKTERNAIQWIEYVEFE